MIIEYDLKGSQAHHKGIFDTNGFWVRFDKDIDDVTGEVTTYKMWSHFGFTFEHVDEDTAIQVYNALIKALTGQVYERLFINEIGYIEIISSS